MTHTKGNEPTDVRGVCDADGLQDDRNGPGRRDGRGAQQVGPSKVGRDR